MLKSPTFYSSSDFGFTGEPHSFAFNSSTLWYVERDTSVHQSLLLSFSHQKELEAYNQVWGMIYGIDRMLVGKSCWLLWKASILMGYLFLKFTHL